LVVCEHEACVTVTAHFQGPTPTSSIKSGP
jgi:hypothetical protein